MPPENPYAAPSEAFAPAEDASMTSGLANRGTRLLAAIVDSIITMAYTLPLMFASGAMEKISRGETAIMESLVVTSIGFLIFLVLHGYYLSVNGQTLGKKLLGIRIADMEGMNPGLTKIFIARLLPLSIVSFIPVVGGMLSLIHI